MRILTRTVWVLIGLIVLLPFIQAALSPLQQGRNPAYVIGGLAGVAALAMLLIQPLFAAGYMPGVARLRQQRWHRWIGAMFGLALLVHIGGLYLTSPDDVSDALLLVSPTPFSVYGVIGLWSAVATILLVLMRRQMRIGVSAWKIVHNILGLVVVVASVVHSVMIDGAMGEFSKLLLCICVLLAMLITLLHLRVIQPWARKTR